jgi:uncharacterized LabA/DUF88 family protein
LVFATNRGNQVWARGQEYDRVYIDPDFAASLSRIRDLLIIITGDADIVPALKFARREGMQVCLDPLRNPIQPELSEHVDFVDSKIPLASPGQASP